MGALGRLTATFIRVKFIYGIVGLCSLSVSTLFGQPIITNVTPLSGPVGATIIISGSGFGSAPASNIVYFGAVKGVVSSASATSLSVTVPTGATYAPVTITTGGKTAYSTKRFTLTFSGGGAITSSSFENKTDFVTGESPYDVAAGDLDGDGKADVVTANGEFPYSLSVFRNTGTSGTIAFATKFDLATGTIPFRLAIDDIDGDGKLDVVVSNSGHWSFSVFRNTSPSPGTITFAPRVDVITNTSPVFLALADLDKDGRPDLTTVNMAANNIAIFKNLSTPGTIQFGAQVNYPGGSSPTCISYGDLDNDGWQDFVVGSFNTTNVILYRNTGAPGGMTFVQSGVLSAGSGYLAGTTVSDFDGDGRNDLVVPGDGGKVVVYRNVSNPGSLSFSPKLEYDIRFPAVSLKVSDWDGDGKADIAACGTDSIAILRNNSSLGSVLFDETANFLTGDSPYSIAASDIDVDGRPDLTVVNLSDNTISILRNSVTAPNIVSFTPASAPSGTIVTINGTNFTNSSAVSFGGTPAQSFSVLSPTQITAVVGTGSTGAVQVANSTGTGKRNGFTYLSPPVIASFGPTAGTTGTVVIVQGSGFNGTTGVSFGGTSAQSFTVVSATTITAVVASGSSGNVAVTTTVGTASLPGFTYSALPPPPVITGFSPASGPIGTTVTIQGQYFNSVPSANVVYFGATKATIVSASQTSLTAIVPPGATDKQILVICNNLSTVSGEQFIVTFSGGSPAFTATSFTSPTILYEPNATADYGFSFADFDGDGKTDFAHLNRSYFELWVNRNTSTLTTYSMSSVKRIFPLGTNYPEALATGDLDGDSKSDVAVANSDATVSVLKNNSIPGTINFAPKIDIPTTDRASRIIISDINLDGRPDILVIRSTFNYFSIYRNTSTGGVLSFAPGLDYPTGSGPMSIAVGDLNGDGKPDIAIANINSGSVSMFRNTSTSGGSVISFAARIDLSAGSRSSNIVMSDLDGDHKKDLVVVNGNSNTITLFRNTSVADPITFAPKVDLTTALYPYGLIVNDFNGDGKPDIVTVNSDPHTFSIYRNKCTPGNLAFSAVMNYENSASSAMVLAGAADINGDGKADIVGGVGGSYYIFRNTSGQPRTLPSGANPVSGQIQTIVRIDSSVQTYNGHPYVQRHYDINPVNNAATATATITLYFTQEEFDNYNTQPNHGLNLPYGPLDNANKANLRIYQYHGFSATGYPGTYSGVGIEINPDDSNIVWNAVADCWEVTFNVTGFSGFFITSEGNSLAPIVYTFIGNGSWDNPSNWSNNAVPPQSPMPNTEIIIAPVSGGECIANGMLTIPNGVKLTVKSGARFKTSL